MNEKGFTEEELIDFREDFKEAALISAQQRQDLLEEIDAMPNKKIGKRELQQIHKKHYGDNPPPEFGFFDDIVKKTPKEVIKEAIALLSDLEIPEGDLFDKEEFDNVQERLESVQDDLIYINSYLWEVLDD